MRLTEYICSLNPKVEYAGKLNRQWFSHYDPFLSKPVVKKKKQTKDLFAKYMEKKC